MIPNKMLLITAGILGWCSIVYELLLGQTLSAFLGNTVLRYSVTIGLYLLALGLGALCAENRFLQNPLRRLVLVELGLAALGGLSTAIVFGAHALLPGETFVWLVGHVLILAIGILSGFELPLLFELQPKSEPHSNFGVLGAGYFGAMLGTVLFAFYFYPTAGLVASAVFVGCVNAAAALLLLLSSIRIPELRPPVFFWVCTLAILGALAAVSLHTPSIEQSLLEQYLRVS